MRLEGRQWWKLVGLASVVGVAATGALVARSERRRRSYTPDEVRSGLHDRYAQATAKQSQQLELPLTEARTGVWTRLRNLLRRC